MPLCLIFGLRGERDRPAIPSSPQDAGCISYAEGAEQRPTAAKWARRAMTTGVAWHSCCSAKTYASACFNICLCSSTLKRCFDLVMWSQCNLILFDGVLATSKRLLDRL